MTDKQITQQLLFVVYFRILASESLSCGNDKFVNYCDRVIDILTKGKNKIKLIKRAVRESEKLAFLFQDTKQNKFYGHKMVLIIYHCMKLFIENNFDFHNEVIELSELFLEIENNQQMNEQDWLKLHQSAQKSGKKMYEILLNDLFKQ